MLVVLGAVTLAFVVAMQIVMTVVLLGLLAYIVTEG